MTHGRLIPSKTAVNSKRIYWPLKGGYIQVDQTNNPCTNCGAALHGSFCSNCGQRVTIDILTFGEFISNALADLTSADSRIWRTVLRLFFFPGVLTHDYLAGRRNRYIPPFRTYLVLSLLFFLVASILESPWVNFLVDENPPGNETALSAGSGREQNPCLNIELDVIGLPYRSEWQAAVRRGCENILEDGSTVNRAFAENIPVMMFFFIPLVALMMKLLYWFSQRKYIEHLLFLIHYHAFFFLALTIVAITTALADRFPVLSIPATTVSVAGWIYIFAYLLIAMRKVYADSWLLTCTKYSLLLVGYGLTFFVALSFAAIYSAVTV